MRKGEMKERENCWKRKKDGVECREDILIAMEQHIE